MSDKSLPAPIVKPWEVPLGGLGRPMQERVAAWANGLIAAAVAQERERCAKLCEGMHDEDRPEDYAWAIRATIPRTTDQEQA